MLSVQWKHICGHIRISFSLVFVILKFDLFSRGWLFLAYKPGSVQLVQEIAQLDKPLYIQIWLSLVLLVADVPYFTLANLDRMRKL